MVSARLLKIVVYMRHMYSADGLSTEFSVLQRKIEQLDPSILLNGWIWSEWGGVVGTGDVFLGPKEFIHKGYQKHFLINYQSYIRGGC